MRASCVSMIISLALLITSPAWREDSQLVIGSHIGTGNSSVQSSEDFRITFDLPSQVNPRAPADSSKTRPQLILRRTIRSREINNPKSVRISPCGKYAYVNNLEGLNTSIIEVATGKILRTIEHTGKPVELAFTEGGRYVWISYFRLLEEGYPRELGDERQYRHRSIVVVYDTLTQKLVARIPVGIIPKVITVSPDGRLVFVANWRSHSVTVIDARSFQVLKEIRVGAVPRGMVFTPSGKHCYVANLGEQTLSVVDVQNLSVVKTITDIGLKPRHLAISRDGGTLYLSNHGDGHLRTLDTVTNRITGVREVGEEPRTIVLSPDGRFLYVVCYESNQLSLLDAETMDILATARTDLHPVGVDVTPDGQSVWVTNQTASTIQVFEVRELIQESVGPAPSAY